MESSVESQSGGPPPVAHPDSAPEVDLQERFIDLHQRTELEVFSFLLRRLGNSDTAMELTQETFVRAWEARDRYDPSQGGRSWVLRIAKNVLVSDHRARTAQKRGRSHTVSLEQLSPADDGPTQRRRPSIPADPHYEDPLDGLIREESIDAMNRAAERLNDKERRLYQLRKQGLSPAEIAEQTGHTKAAVFSALTRIYEKLRAALPPP